MGLPWWFPFGKVDELTAQELYAKIKNESKNLQLIDVRSAAEYVEGHVAKTRNVPIQTLPHRLKELKLDPNRPVIAICLSGHRSVPAYRLLKRAGFTQVYQLAGGMMAWRREGLPTVKDGRR
ncbi:MAG: rhodanese-like domain-containing protein [Chloroflexi bacterium]|nr:rhodanese-like domain-containing protein [Chloroflexota bacterium]